MSKQDILFESRKTQFQNQFNKAKTISQRYTWLRVLLFLGLVTSLFFEFKFDFQTYFVIPIGIGLSFYVAIVFHQKSENKSKLLDGLIHINEEEIQRVNLQLSHFEDGSVFAISNHLYQDDLDILGKHSAFQLINRCEIDDSKALLAEWLSHPADKDSIEKRQEAIKELSAKTDWAQTFRASTRLAMAQKKKREPEVSGKQIIDWASQKSTPLNAQLWKILALILSGIFIVIGVLVILGILPHTYIYPLVLVNMIVLSFGIRHLHALSKGMDKSYYVIQSYATALEAIEKESFTSAPLVDLKNKLISAGASATHAISQLANISYKLSARASMFYALIDVPLLLDIHILAKLARWKEKHQHDIGTWLQAISEMECLMSIAGFARCHPDYAFPVISTEPFCFNAKQMGHPLISDDNKVRNDYDITGEGSVDIITGSNMSGKSTFQRTVGLNMVLAQMGAPVDASALTMSPTTIFTSMRTKDNLEEHTSSFYAELKRIALLLEITNRSTSVFFILDEILKGTNSEDRHLGSVALAKKLGNSKAFGLISTHDLGLGAMAEATDGVRNFSFNSTIEGDKIVFDYHLTAGVCRSFNASQLMKNMGIL